VQRLDTSEGDHQSKFSPDTIPKSAMPLWLGHRLDAEGRVVGRAVIPLALTLHCYLSGTTGSGKSYLTRTIIEEAAKYDLGILILDPRNQSAGLLVGEDRPEILKAYEGFGMKSDGSRGFPFSYFAPAMPWSQALPKALAELASGRSIVSFKGMDDADRCTLFAKVLDAVFEASSSQESDRLRLLIVVDEAQRFTRKRVDESAKPRAGEAERALDRTAREGRKYGQALMLVSQSIKDFTFDAASIRQQINTHAFLRNIDREMEYAADILGDGKQLAHLPTGTALVHNAAWGTLHVQVRPPFSKVFEFNEADTCNIAAPERRAGVGISAEAQKLLDLIRQNTSQQPLNLTTIATLAKITSKRRLLAIIEELESTGAIRTRSLPERGRPRIVDCSEQTYRDNTIPGASLDS